MLIPVDCDGAAASRSPQPSPQPTKTTTSTPLDGAWEVTYTKDEFVAAHPDQGEVNPSNYGTFTLTFDRGDFTYVGGSSGSSTAPGTSATGTYVVDDKTIVFYVETENSIWRYTWSVYGGTLKFEKLGGEEPGNDCNSSVSVGQCEPTGLAVKAWRANH